MQNSPAEQVILADITRTFTAHEKFQNESEGGQDAMYKISKVSSSKGRTNPEFGWVVVVGGGGVNI